MPHRIKRLRKRRAIRLVIQLFAWVGVALLYYACFSLLFDTPDEHRMRESTNKMRQEYEAMAERYDSLEMILDNITERDKSVFRILFESDPYNLDIEQNEARLALYEKNIAKSKRQLSSDLNLSIDNLSSKMAALESSWNKIKELGDGLGDKSQNIPSIQPVLNKQLTLLTAGYGNILNPFYRTPKSHQGVDYTIAEGSSVFATADGVVREISDKNSTLGKTIVIDHGNGYTTCYTHMDSISVKMLDEVSAGDVIGKMGSTGWSTGPHLHFEIRIDGEPVDPFGYVEIYR